MTPIIITLTLFGLGLLALALQRRYPRLSPIAARLLLSYAALMLVLIGAELYLRHQHTDSGWSFTLAYRNWYERYYQENSWGFRDAEHSPDDYADQTKVLIIGDSFAAGWGVQDPSERFGDVLAAHLGADYAVMLAARPGGTPERALNWLRDYPIKPDVVIYQYYLNDIDDAALSIGDFWRFTIPDYPAFIDESHLANFVYWRIAPLFSAMQVSDDASYWAWNDRTFENAVIFELHRAELEAIMDAVEGLEARLIVVLFPNMRDPVGSIGHLDAIEAVFRARGYGEILALDDEVVHWSVDEATVSWRDAHPSAAFHRRVGDLLYERFFAPSAP